ncbi:MAG: VOC family protein [Bacteroidota bacterium]
MTPTEPINKGAIEGIAPLLQVFDMPNSLRFYRDILGFTVQESSGQGDDVDWVLLKLNDFILMLNTAYERDSRPSSPDPARLAGHQDLTLYLGYPDIDVFYEYLSGKGVKVDRPQITKYNWKAIHFFDPDGYQICFHWPVK